MGEAGFAARHDRAPWPRCPGRPDDLPAEARFISRRVERLGVRELAVPLVTAGCGGRAMAPST